MLNHDAQGKALIAQTTAGMSFINIASAGTTVVKSGSGVLDKLIISKCVALGTITIYDNTSASGTKIATITNPSVLLQQSNTLPFGIAFSNGLTVVSSSTDDFTVVYS